MAASSTARASAAVHAAPRDRSDLAGDIDVGPLDSYALDLMLRHEPELGDRIRIVASTEAAPIPLLVASQDCPADVVDALRAALLRFGVSPDCAELSDNSVSSASRRSKRRTMSRSRGGNGSRCCRL